MLVQAKRQSGFGLPFRDAFDAAANDFTIDRVKVTDGAVVFTNLRDRFENRIDDLNVDVLIGADRQITFTGNARSGAFARGTFSYPQATAVSATSAFSSTADGAFSNTPASSPCIRAWCAKYFTTPTR